jgi:cytoplasmic tRNA 2-thiolation protein 2
MGPFRVRFSAADRPRKLLLPVSFGVSSLTLLHVLDHHLSNQKEKTGRMGFELQVLFVDTSAVERASPEPQLVSHLKDQFSDHCCITVSLSSILANDSTSGEADLREFLPAVAKADAQPLSAEQRLEYLVKSLPSATARSDVISVLRIRLIAKIAEEKGCEGILWGDCTTRLAEKTLAETAKGRGFSLPWQVTDGESPYGIAFNYPLQDLLKKELVAYANMANPSFSSLIHQSSGSGQPSASSKNTTIDDLMKQYFESVEENYPSIVANVVRITSKLQAPPSQSTGQRCKLCSMPVTNGNFGIHGWGGNQQDSVGTSSELSGNGFCYGCTRSVPQATVLLP